MTTSFVSGVGFSFFGSGFVVGQEVLDHFFVGGGDQGVLLKPAEPVGALVLHHVGEVGGAAADMTLAGQPHALLRAGVGLHLGHRSSPHFPWLSHALDGPALPRSGQGSGGGGCRIGHVAAA